jgi:hypothetical protein
MMPPYIFFFEPNLVADKYKSFIKIDGLFVSIAKNYQKQHSI